ncbi:uncharacterized protein LOC136095186 [Hydra vulgaris]|uniref:uncharacterized protein LOC136095186 n=1 Tax=Hydra vulgaris TaxID=6087 RepID=UPI0032EA3F4B
MNLEDNGNIPINQFGFKMGSDRRQAVVIGNYKSKERLVKLGVGQGTCIGSLLFKIYVYDLSSATELDSYFFANDTTIVAKADSIEEYQELCCKELEKISNCFVANGHTLHPEKTKIMIFGSKKKSRSKVARSQGHPMW